MTAHRTKLIKTFVAVVLGNLLYFILAPHLPPAAQHHSWNIDLGTMIDFWFCLAVYGVIELGISLRHGHTFHRGKRN